MILLPFLLVLTRESVYEKDMHHATTEIGKQCASLIAAKKIDWAAVSKEFMTEARAVKTDEMHLKLLVRLLARLHDGHAAVKPLGKGQSVHWPDDDGKAKILPGMSWCRVGDRMYVKASAGGALSAGIKPGLEIVSVDGTPVKKWLEERIAKISDLRSFSTDQHAFFFTCYAGLADASGTKRKLELVDGGKKVERTLAYGKNEPLLVGPVALPKEAESRGDLDYGTLASGYGYIHLRRSPEDLTDQIDVVLAKLAKVPGLILDFRGNSGGGLDHDAFLGRFIPKGKTLSFAKKYASAGANPYGGPIVVIVDATVVSAGETLSGIFKEDGRGYMIGESNTAGMSSQKTTIELPSGLFSLYVSIGSNKSRFNGGKGIEGIGVVPHEIVPYDPKDLAAGTDTLIRRAEALLAKFPQDKVPYRAGS
jgi:C-terminal processing protease CtpA/Prc